MANTAMSQIVLDSVILEGRTRARILWGKLAATDKPGNVVQESAANTWTKGDADTSAHHLLKMGIIEFNPRTSATFGEVDIDTAYATTDDVPIVVGSYGGPLKIAAFCDDQSGTVFFGVSFVISTTAGQWDAETLEVTGSVSSGTAIRHSFRVYLAEEGLVTADTKGFFYFG